MYTYLYVARTPEHHGLFFLSEEGGMSLVYDVQELRELQV